ncbi:LysR family transcriptional regulator [Streptomyces sp. NPDC049954]|uniref:LysR family transcriptional regulator n=1 Tax=Streptomyces sp. NPDC049954 TaxID=3155779 RepID=UPI00342A128B
MTEGLNRSALRAADEAEALPAILREALTSPSAWQRLSRFMAARSCPTFTDASRDLGIHPSALGTRINRLEADLGSPSSSEPSAAGPSDGLRSG